MQKPEGGDDEIWLKLLGRHNLDRPNRWLRTYMHQAVWKKMMKASSCAGLRTA